MDKEKLAKAKDLDKKIEETQEQLLHWRNASKGWRLIGEYEGGYRPDLPIGDDFSVIKAIRVANLTAQLDQLTKQFEAL